MDTCLICERIDLIKKGTNPYVVKELETGYVVIGDHQFCRGYTLFLCKIHATELHELEPDFRYTFLREMSTVAEAVWRAFHPVKLNYELLGNSDPHLHWHIFPRHHDDPEPRRPIWLIGADIRKAKESEPNPEELINLKNALLGELDALLLDKK
ncbi:MAG: HIT family protein [Candidatus Sungbacteria bacterium]|uniref:HIT family protein n=1 Tax=Candidatus Sungiibacteriota bacterium TaxID=2750080 RepID=A0A932QXX4_9BACT|nr:HIT family protein [Candidatus Sungbacteria bacterium]